MKDGASDQADKCCNTEVDIKSLEKNQYTTNRACIVPTSNLAIHLRGSKSADSTN